MEDWAGTFFISHLPLPFTLLALLAQRCQQSVDRPACFLFKRIIEQRVVLATLDRETGLPIN